MLDDAILGLVQLAAINFGFIGMKAFQQRNVAFAKYLGVVIVTAPLAAMEIWIIGEVARRGLDFPTWLAVYLGATSGACLSIYLWSKVYKNG